MRSPYTIYLRDTNLTRIGEITEWTELDLRLLHNDVSHWILNIPANQLIASDIIFGRGIIVERNNTVVLSGPIDNINRQWDADNDSFTLSGPDDTIYVADKTAKPVTDSYDYSLQAYDIRTGLASTVIMEYVNFNVGPGALPERQKLGLILADDLLIGSTVTGNARFDSLIELIRSLALAGGDLAFRVVQSETAAELIFQVYQPTDKTQDVIFSTKLGNLHAFNYAAAAPEVNHIIVGGGGEGVARLFYEQEDTESITLFDRTIEQFRDRRDTVVLADLQQTAIEELTQKASKTSLSITPIDSDLLAFMVDYQLGDKVTVIADNLTIQDVIREINIKVESQGGEVIIPSVGTPDSGRKDIFKIFSSIRAVRSRISNVERSL